MQLLFCIGCIEAVYDGRRLWIFFGVNSFNFHQYCFSVMQMLLKITIFEKIAAHEQNFGGEAGFWLYWSTIRRHHRNLFIDRTHLYDVLSRVEVRGDSVSSSVLDLHPFALGPGHSGCRLPVHNTPELSRVAWHARKTSYTSRLEFTIIRNLFSK